MTLSVLQCVSLWDILVTCAQNSTQNSLLISTPMNLIRDIHATIHESRLVYTCLYWKMNEDWWSLIILFTLNGFFSLILAGFPLKWFKKIEIKTNTLRFSIIFFVYFFMFSFQLKRLSTQKCWLFTSSFIMYLKNKNNQCIFSSKNLNMMLNLLKLYANISICVGFMFKICESYIESRCNVVIP